MTPLNFRVYSSYIGIPYAETMESEGLNCWQLCEKILIEVFGTRPPNYHYYGDFKNVGPVFVSALEQWKKIEYENRSAGDLVLLRMSGYPIHLGIVISDKIMIHTLKQVGSRAEDYTCFKWKNRVIGFYRWNQ